MSKKTKTNFHDVPWVVEATDIFDSPAEPFCIASGLESQEAAEAALATYRLELSPGQLEALRFEIKQGPGDKENC